MDPRIYRHLILPRLGRDWAYTPVQPPIPPVKLPPVQNRPAHAQALQKSLTTIEKRAEARAASQRAALPEDECGILVRFNPRLGRNVDLSFFEKASHGVELLSVRQERRMVVRAFVPKKSIGRLSSAISKYGEWSEGQHKPAFTDFFEGIDNLTVADVERLWHARDGVELPKDGIQRWEVWLRPRVVEYVKASSSRYSVELSPFETRFPNATVIRMRAAFAGLKALLLDTASVIEIRPASTANVPISALTPVERAGLVRKIASRIAPAPEGSPRVAILDTGVQFQHGLLRQSLPEARTHTVLPAWQKDDVDGHGTRMAGVALFGDLNRFVSGSSAIPLTHALESVTLIGKGGATMGPAQRLSAALAKIERDDARRVYSLSWSVPMERDDGAPTELSSHLDQLAFGRDQSKRLFCVAAGNLDSHPPLLVADYIGTNDRSGILTPGQAANALTVGAYTDMVGPASKQSHAGRGDLCPSSRTAMSWKTHLAFKPDIVMEGGNRLVDSDGMSLSFSPDLSVLTTSNQFPRLPFEPGCETSIATAAAAGMAARLMSEYPSFWPETIRGLMVHSARWTPAMLNRLPGGRKKDVVSLLRRFGWGVPDETRARQSASNALTIIMQDDLDAFELKRDGAKFRHMRFCRLPWPKVALESIAAADVEMRVTLSYFAEPHPLAASHAELRNYFSHALAFRLCGPDDTDDEAIALINKRHREKGHKKSSARRKDHWMLGPKAAAIGTIKQDIWSGKAGELATTNGISIIPGYGWWSNLRTTVVPQTRVRFSLIVSIEAPSVSADLMVEAQKALIKLPIRAVVEV